MYRAGSLLSRVAIKITSVRHWYVGQLSFQKLLDKFRRLGLTTHD